MRLLYCVAALLAVACMVNGAEASKNKINSLPGLTFTPQFDQYTGYITIDESLGKEYFYWFVESENDPENDPIVLWMQGGPGCSGLLVGIPLFSAALLCGTMTTLSWTAFVRCLC